MALGLSESYSTDELAFEKAIDSGRLNDDEHSSNYAGDYMYMGRDTNGRDAFKNIDSRQYLA
ncbi:MAG: hypothetical protein V3T82_07975 [Nitrospinaceae bacterium]